MWDQKLFDKVKAIYKGARRSRLEYYAVRKCELFRAKSTRGTVTGLTFADLEAIIASVNASYRGLSDVFVSIMYVPEGKYLYRETTP